MKQSRLENIIYLAVWGLLFAAPLLSLYVRTVSDTNIEFNWTEVFIVWRHFAVYLLLFLVHNFLLAPLLVHRQKRILYFSLVTVLLVAFVAYRYNSRPDRNDHHMPPMEKPLPPPSTKAGEMMGKKPPFRHHPPPFRRDMKEHDVPPPFFFIGEHEIMAIVVLLLMFGANLGIKNYIRSRDDRKRLVELEKQNLEQQLEYLRYQINPHFFMNTLNNIHALVDIDPEKAKDTILELSKMMRFVLYEGNKQGVPLSRELEFIRHYIALMQLRYTDKVRIDVSLPVEVPDRQIPPLILITFVENAFKHGISYEHESFVHVGATVSSRRLHFRCSNSKGSGQIREKGGVGLTNVRQRLDLIYGEDYTLSIDDRSKTYDVELEIPLV
jgi:two-component sensor histidine kinase